MFRQIEALQDKVLAKEERKLAERAARDRLRVQRFMNARARTLSVDSSALAAQLEEKRRLKELEQEAARAEAERAAFVKQQLEAKDAMERSTRRALVQSIKAEWVQQAEAQRGRNQVNRAFLEEGMTPATCGLGALQKLEGEDVGLAERRQAQARAQRAWILEQLGKKESARRAAAAQEAAEVAAQVHIQELLRTHAEAEAAYRKALTEAIQVENKEQAARERAAVAAAEAGRRAEEQALLERLRRDPMLSEVNDCVCPATGRVLPDRFRGYTAEQRARIAAENSALVHEKSRRQEEERAAEAAWARQQEAWSLRVKQLQKAEEKARKDLELVTRAALQEQEEDHRKRTEQARADAFGRIEQEQGLHSKFGTSLA